MSQQARPSLRALTLRAVCPHRFVSDNRTQINICALNSCASIDAELVRGRSVLLKTSIQLATVLALLDLDGVAARVVLCTPDQAQYAEAIQERASIDLVVDSSESIYQHSGHPVWEGDRSIETEWVLLTSGTTGLPKMAIHTLSSLAGPLDDGLNVATEAIWSTFYDVRRYGGIQILLRALLGGGSMILSSPDESPTEFLKRLGSKGVTHISGTPSHWRRALMSTAATAMSPCYVRLSGEIVDQAILDQLRRTYPKANLGWAFASTEAGVGFDVRDGKEGFPASYIKNPNLNAEVTVKNGTLHIRSTRTARGYIGAPLNGHDGWVDTGDLVELRGDRYYFAGRRDGVINVGGQKVCPEEVEAVARQHPAIRMARAKPRRNSVTGNLVALDVVLHENRALSSIRDDLMAHCRRNLAKWKVPVSINQVNTIEITPAGKMARA
jgi:acyl-CoA synthetase (AMP-forming)/AMP-acid ligase II